MGWGRINPGYFILFHWKLLRVVSFDSGANDEDDDACE